MSGLPVGRLFVLGFPGHTIPEDVRDFAKTFGLGGIILFGRNCPDPETVAGLAAEAKTLCTPPPLVFIDQEGGRVERIKSGVLRLPPARELSGLTVSEIERLAALQSADLLKLGVDVNLAPVCDVVREGESGVIGDRGFSTDPKEAAGSALAFLKGMTKAGILGCAKHFPGHGASPKDTHLGPGVVDLSEMALREVDLFPFNALISGGVPLIMACHVTYPAVDPNPACFSEKWLKAILRDELSFKGVVITDDMEMSGATDITSPVEGGIRAVAAGADMLIYGRMLKSTIDVFEIAAGIRGKVPHGLLSGAISRVDALLARR